MRKVTYIDFEPGDPEPMVPYVLDSDGDKWVKDGDTWYWGNLGRTWEEMLEDGRIVRISESQFEDARAEIERQAAELEEKAAKLRAALGPVSAVMPREPRHWTGNTLPEEPGLKVRDRDGDVWQQGRDGKVEGGHWHLSAFYVPYTEVLDTP